MGKVRVGLLAAAAALVLAGCVARTGGAPERAPAAGEPVRLDYDTLVNEVAPCSLTGPAAYEPHGTARMPGRPDMDRCRVSVATSDGPVHVWVGQAQTTDNLPGHRTKVADLGRGATIERFGDGCDTALVFDETSAIIATARPAGGEQPPGQQPSGGQPSAEQPSDDLLCALTSGAAEGVFNVLAGDRVKFWIPPSNSFATVSACEAVPTTLLAEQLGIASPEPTAPPTKHWCQWGDEDGNWAMLGFPVAESPTEVGVPAGTPAETTASRESWVVPGGTICTVYTKHIEFTIGVGTFELAALTVTMPGNEDPCGAARVLAASAWQNLPAFS